MAQHDQAGMLIATLFLARDLTHREHLKVTGPGSDAAHRALEAFYDKIVDLADTLTETYQGCFNCALDIPLLAHEGELTIIAVLDAQRRWIRETRYEAISADETPLHNIVDEIEQLYMHTLFRLRRLQ